MRNYILSVLLIISVCAQTAGAESYHDKTEEYLLKFNTAHDLLQLKKHAQGKGFEMTEFPSNMLVVGVDSEEYQILQQYIAQKKLKVQRFKNRMSASNVHKGALTLPEAKVEQELERKKQAQVNDYFFSDQWSLLNAGGPPNVHEAQPPYRDSGIVDAWETTTGLTDGVVAIFGEKVDISHEDLDGAFWVNPGEIAGNSLDDDGNGYIDDIHGLNAKLDNGDVTEALVSSSTGMTGIIAAKTNNVVGIAGMTEHDKTLTCHMLDSHDMVVATEVIKCFSYIKDLKVNHNVNIHSIIIPWSLSTSDKSEVEWLSDEIEALIPLGIFVITPANYGFGNEQEYPTAFQHINLITVLAASPGSPLNQTINWQTTHLAAPGWSVPTTVPGKHQRFHQGNSAFFESFENGSFEQWSVIPPAFSSTNVVAKDGLSSLAINKDNYEGGTELISKPFDLSSYHGTNKKVYFSYSTRLIRAQTLTGAQPNVEISASVNNASWLRVASTYTNNHYSTWSDGFGEVPINFQGPVEDLQQVRIKVEVDNLRYWGDDLLYIDNLGIGLEETHDNSDIYGNIYADYAAAAHVAGAISLIRSARPDWTLAQIKNLLISSGLPHGEGFVVGDKMLNLSGRGEQSLLTCASQPVKRLLEPKHSGVFITAVNEVIPMVAINIDCSEPQGPVNVSHEGTVYSLQDEAPGYKHYEGDGIYANASFAFTQAGSTSVQVDGNNRELVYRVYSPYQSPEEVTYEWLEPEDPNNTGHAYNLRSIALKLGNIYDNHFDGDQTRASVRRGYLTVVPKQVAVNSKPQESAPEVTMKPEGENFFPLSYTGLALVAYSSEGIGYDFRNYVVGEAPNRRWVGEYMSDNHSQGSDPMEFQIVLSESTSDVRFNYKRVHTTHSVPIGAPSVGIQVGSETVVLFNGELNDEMSLLFKAEASDEYYVNQAPTTNTITENINLQQKERHEIDLLTRFDDENVNDLTFTIDPVEIGPVDGVYIDDSTLVVDTRVLMFGERFVVRATDPEGLFAEFTASISIRGEPPRVVKSLDLSFERSENMEVDLSEYFTDNLDDTLTYSIEVSGDRFSILDQYSLNGSIFTLLPDVNRLYTFDVRATDNDGLSVALRGAINVWEHLPPVANDDHISARYRDGITFNVTVNDTDVNGNIDRDSVTIVSSVSHGELEWLGNGQVQYLQFEEFSGTDTFTYTVADETGLVSNLATATITVPSKPENTPPVALDDSYTTNFETGVRITPAVNDYDEENNIDPTTVEFVTEPRYGSFVVGAYNEISYSPNPNFSGVEVVDYVVFDTTGLRSNRATVTITVRSKPAEPSGGGGGGGSTSLGLLALLLLIAGRRKRIF